MTGAVVESQSQGRTTLWDRGSAGLHGEVLVHHGAQGDRIPLVSLGVAEVDDEAAWSRDRDRVLQRLDLVADRLDHQIERVDGLRSPGPGMAGQVLDAIEAEGRTDR